MRLSLLKIIHTTLSRRANNMAYKEFPVSLNSLEKTSPTKTEIETDYGTMRTHFNHPIFSKFVPTYDEMQNPEEAWLKRYIEQTNSKIISENKANQHNY